MGQRDNLRGLLTTDEHFVFSFFLTYRRFCQPVDVITQFIERLKDVESHDTTQDVRHWALQRCVGRLTPWTCTDRRLASALVRWTILYPGDFADGRAKAALRETITIIDRHSFMSHILGELLAFETKLDSMVDLDASWSFKSTTVTATPSSVDTELVIEGQIVYDFEESLLTKAESTSTADNASNKASSSSIRSSPSVHSLGNNKLHRRSFSETRLAGYHGATPGADLLRLNRHADALQAKWAGGITYVMTCHPKEFAAELTKVQWEMFESIRVCE